MSLKREIATLEEVPEAVRSLYVERDGKHVLDVEGGLGEDGVKALERERTARSNAEKLLKDLRTKLGDIDPVKAREALKTLAELEDKAALGELPAGIAAKVEDLVAKRAQRGIEAEKARADAAESGAAKLQAQLSQVLISDRLRAAASRAGVRATAMDDVVLLGERVFKIKDGAPVPMNGDEVIAGKDAKPMSMEEWLGERAKDRPHWFEGSGGGGTPASRTNGNGAVVLTRDQARDPARYRAAKEQAQKAGVELQIS